MKNLLLALSCGLLMGTACHSKKSNQARTADAEAIEAASEEAIEVAAEEARDSTRKAISHSAPNQAAIDSLKAVKAKGKYKKE